MVALVEQHRSEIAALCRKYGVARLDVFGSAATGEAFDPDRSDVDFVVEYAPDHDLGPWLAHYFEFSSELEQLLRRPVDVVIGTPSRNPYFVRELQRTRRKLYAA